MVLQLLGYGSLANIGRNFYNAWGGGSSGGSSGGGGEPANSTTPMADTTAIPDYSGGTAPTTSFGDIMPNTGGGGTTGGTTNVVTGDIPTEDTGSADSAYDQATQIINDAFNTGMQALSDIEATLQPDFEDTKSGLLNQQETLSGQARAKEELDLGQLQENERVEGKRTESAIAGAQRMASEWMQGLASQFGGSTGIGQFGGELIGREALSNINENKIKFQEVRGKIIEAGNKIKLATNTFVENLELQTQQLISDAQAELRQALRDIATRRDMLGQQKADRQLQALYAYQDTINGINQRNTALKQDMFLKAQDASNKLSSLLASKAPTYTASYDEVGNPVLQGSGFTSGNTSDFGKAYKGFTGNEWEPNPVNNTLTPVGTGNLENQDLNSFLQGQ